ncbi:MAG: hypothetical protein KG003_08975 [Bacteroidetes bacterium]|nr:hypothetical protein [Bacteroidota bacterium]
MDDILHDKLANASLDADGISWEDFQNKKTKRRAVWWWWASGAATIAVVLVCFNWIGNISENVKGQETSTAQNKSSESISPKGILLNPGANLRQRNSGNNSVSQSGNYFNRNQHAMENRSKHNGFNTYRNAPVGQIAQDQLADNELKEINPIYENEKQYQSTEEIAAEIYKKVDAATHSNMDSFNHAPFVKLAEKDVNSISKNKDKNSDKNGIDLLHIKGLYFQLQAGANLNYPNFLVSSYGSQFIHKNYENIRKNSEKGLWGYSFQLHAGKEVGRFAIETGLGFTFMEIAANYQFSYSEKPIRDIDGRIVGYNNTTPEWIQFKNTHKYYFTDIPVMLKYTVFNSPKKILRLKTGAVAQIMNGIQGSLPDAVLLDQREKLRSENFKSFSTALDFGLEYGWKKGDKNQWILAPYYRKNWGLDQVQSLYKMRFNYFGFALSYRRSL